jgi:hypothetical protein
MVTAADGLEENLVIFEPPIVIILFSFGLACTSEKYKENSSVLN